MGVHLAFGLQLCALCPGTHLNLLPQGHGNPRDRGVREEHVADGVTANYPRHLAIEGPTQEVQAWEHVWLWVSPRIILQFHRLGTRPLVGHICQAQGTDLPQHSWSSYQAAFQLFCLIVSGSQLKAFSL